MFEVAFLLLTRANLEPGLYAYFLVCGFLPFRQRSSKGWGILLVVTQMEGAFPQGLKPTFI